MWDRRKVYSSRLGLRNLEMARSVFINEDLTKTTADLFYEARQIRRRNLIKSCWTEGGVLHIRKLNGTVKSIQNINEMAENELRELNFTDARTSSSTDSLSRLSTENFNRLGECRAVQDLRNNSSN